MENLTLGAKWADIVASMVGSWPFIIYQSIFLIIWMLINDTNLISVDPYPNVFLNLLLSFQAAYATPFILMSQNRQAQIDRLTIVQTLQAELRELEELKLLRQEIQMLAEGVKALPLLAYHTHIDHSRAD